jgi:uncharacterized protein DUF4286
MILYNVTVSVDPAISEQWLSWMKKVHIEEVMATGIFESYSIYKVLLVKDESISFSVQYFTRSMAKLQEYQAKYATALQAKHAERYGEKVMAFRTVLEEA